MKKSELKLFDEVLNRFETRVNEGKIERVLTKGDVTDLYLLIKRGNKRNDAF